MTKFLLPSAPSLQAGLPQAGSARGSVALRETRLAAGRALRSAGVSPALFRTGLDSRPIAFPRFRFARNLSSRFLAVSILALTLACAFAAKAAPQDATESHTESAILQLEQKWLKALESGDASTLQAILADDWQDNASLGRIVTRKEFFDWLAANPPRRILGVTSQIVEPKVRFYGDVAIATGAVVREMTDPSGKKHVQHTLFTDVLVWRDARWQAVASQETLVPGGPE